MQPGHPDPDRTAGLIATMRAATEGTMDATALVDGLLAFTAANPRHVQPDADHAVRDLLRLLTEPFREQAISEITARADGQDAGRVAELSRILGLVADRRHPGRRELLADLQLSVLHPEPLRARLRAALLADATATDAATGWITLRGAASACATLAGELSGAEQRAVARWVITIYDNQFLDDSALGRCRDDSLGGSLAKRRLGWSAAETAELLNASRVGTISTNPKLTPVPALRGNELRFALPAAEQLPDTELRTLAPLLHTIVDDLAAGHLAIDDYRMAKTAPRRFAALLERAEPTPDSVRPTLPPGFLGAPDSFATRTHTDAADILADPRAVPLLLHCTTVTSVRATATWQRHCRKLADAYPDALPTTERILRLVLTTKVMRIDGYQHQNACLMPESAAFVRGVVWAYAALAGPDGAPLLGDVAVHCGRKDLRLPGSMVDGQVANAAVAALGSLDGDGALDQLRRVQSMAQHRTFQKSVATALDAAALRSGLTPEQIIERSVPDHGIDASGRFAVRLGADAVASIVVDADGSAGLEYALGGVVVRSLPAAMREAYAGEIKKLKARLKEVQGTLRTERDRIEAILATARTWPAGEWVRYYLGHPLAGVVARRLIWEVAPGPEGPWFAGLPEAVEAAGVVGAAGAAEAVAAADADAGGGTPGSANPRSVGGAGWRLRSFDGAVQAIGSAVESASGVGSSDVSATGADSVSGGGSATGMIVRLWHPVRAAVADVEAWRAFLTDNAHRQPFKQAFREIYLLTPAEEATGSYSNRFAGHILRYGQVKALSMTRGWGGLSLGSWSSGLAGEAAHEFPGTGWRARFFLDMATVDRHGVVAELCATDQVRFERRGGGSAGRAGRAGDVGDVGDAGGVDDAGGDAGRPRPRGAWQPADLADVPKEVLSEAFRDVDLFVGVASIGADPRWTDHGDARHAAYWREFSFGELPESASARRSTLARLMPRTRIADRVELTERFLWVRGDLRTYKIHLGSGNVLMEPNDAYLCIVDARSRDAGRVFLPFEENGGVLSLIVSKAFLLADDRKITDASITRQIGGL